jgi:hypothetical protein
VTDKIDLNKPVTQAEIQERLKNLTQEQLEQARQQQVDAAILNPKEDKEPGRDFLMLNLTGSVCCAMAFDYEAAETDDEKVRVVAAEISGAPLAPLSPEEIALRAVERETRQELYRQQQEQRRLELEQQEAARAEQQQAEWLKEHRQQEAIRQRERSAEIDREVNRRAMFDLRAAASRADTFQRDVRNSHAQNAKAQYTNSLMAELERSINEAPLTKPSSNFATLYRENQRSGWYYVTPEDFGRW